MQCIGVQRRATAEPLRWGNEQAPGCPVPRVPAWATRTIRGWRLDRDRLAAVVAVVAPGVSILDTGTDALPDDEQDDEQDDRGNSAGFTAIAAGLPRPSAGIRWAPLAVARSPAR